MLQICNKLIQVENWSNYTHEYTQSVYYKSTNNMILNISLFPQYTSNNISIWVRNYLSHENSNLKTIIFVILTVISRFHISMHISYTIKVSLPNKTSWSTNI